MTDVLRSQSRWPLAARYALALAVSALLGWTAISAILERTGGEPAVPLDDTFIHFQYARSFIAGAPLRYTEGAEPAAGATSLLWPAGLAVFMAAGLRDLSIVWVTWAFGFLALALLAVETRRLAEGLTTAESALCAGLMVLAFAGFTWFAASGMEVLPFAWLLTRTARRSSEWSELSPLARSEVWDRELPGSAPVRRLRTELCVLGVLSPLMRPEGALASLLASAALLAYAEGRQRTWGLIPLFGPLVPSLLNWLLTGEGLSTTAQTKWLLFSPYHYGGRLSELISYNVRLLLETLLDGQVWSALFLPSGGRVLAWLCLPALVLAGVRTRHVFRAAAVLLLALGLFMPTTYDTFLWNRLRYLWPFAAAWFVGLAAVGDALGFMAARLKPELGGLRWLFGGICIGALASKISVAVDDLATSADAIRRQQVALGRWAATALAPSARIGVNDTGAIGYFSGHQTFDVVGLTTRGEARYWVAGPGSRFEHYEKMKPSDRPTHYIVYPEWFGLPALLGETLTERRVAGATILGGETMAAYVADHRALGSAATPTLPPRGVPIDELDVADLESEESHAYQLYATTQLENIAVEDPSTQRWDGARKARTRETFEIEIAPGGVLLARLGASAPLRLEVHVASRAVGELSLTGRAWEELTIVIPTGVPAGRQQIELIAVREKSFVALHYWSYAPRK
ncbi:MAG TPA: hypothetical protein VK524_23840 [Polyangiaceae bacterium]|nr:hypothetical protein [Polyangiaceae bacterium]